MRTSTTTVGRQASRRDSVSSTVDAADYYDDRNEAVTSLEQFITLPSPPIYIPSGGGDIVNSK